MTDLESRASPSLAPHPDVRNWLLDGIRLSREQSRRYSRTAREMILHPKRLVADWATGQWRAQNPLAFLTTSAGITAGLGLAAQRLGQHAGQVTTADVLVREIEPYVQYFLLGLLCHAFLRLLGAKQPWFLTLGVSLFAGGGPAAAASVLTSAFTVVAALTPQSSDSLTSQAVTDIASAGIVVANLSFFVSFALGLSGIHRLHLWRILSSLLCAEATLILLRVAFFELLYRMAGQVGA